MHELVMSLAESGFAWLRGSSLSSERALGVARALIDERCVAEGVRALDLIGDFVIAPYGGGATRDFQTLHFDFGLPLDPMVDQDIARFTALHVPGVADGVSAVTRLVPMETRLGQRDWARQPELKRRLIGYGRTHGAWGDRAGYTEGSLARIIEAASGLSPTLTSVKAEPGFLCGTEFDTLGSELAFFSRHGLRVEDVQIEAPLRPGDLLVFDNLALAHGRRGARRPGELRQWVFGHRRLSPVGQRELRDRVLAAFRSA